MRKLIYTILTVAMISFVVGGICRLFPAQTLIARIGSSALLKLTTTLLLLSLNLGILELCNKK